MYGPLATQMHERPFKAAKEPVQPLAVENSFLPKDEKFLISCHLSFSSFQSEHIQ